jgi:hypothetical protein
MEDINKLDWLAEAVMYKKLAQANFGEACKEYNDGCMICRAHRLADNNLESAIEYYQEN